MRIVVISASTRLGSESLMVAEYVAAHYQTQSINAEVLDLYEHMLPIYDDSETGPWQAIWQPMSQLLQKADGYVFVAPEWNGTIGPGLPNMMLYAQHELAHKPVMLIGVSSGSGGTYSVVDMRLMGYKNRHYVIIPENAIIHHVRETLVSGKIVDQDVADRVHYGTEVLIQYAESLKLVRSSGVINLQKFRHGV